MSKVVYAPGARLVVRDAEWLVQRVEPTSTGGEALHCVGISEIVKEKQSIFLTELEPSITPMDPKETSFRHDTSQQYQAALLYLESKLRQSPPTDENLYIGHKGAMDPLPYQLKPALEALRQPRQRILIADAVGLGKTLEAGILLAELIKRGRGKRILVVAIKSMLTQFQKEIWSRFSIPLTRLDSTGLQRIRERIPTNHNPFHYYDKSIISIDTLKQNNEYRNYLEQAYWDIIVIDEAHNVADRGTSALRNKLAQRLARRSDTLIMLSATPHDGRPESFASLMNMLDPTAIADPARYTKDDIRGLYIRRYKKDVAADVQMSFKERQIFKGHTDASSAEERAYDIVTRLSFQQLDSHKRKRGFLFKTTLQKALFSSPQACYATVVNRLKKIEKQRAELTDKGTASAIEDANRLAEDATQLETLRDAVAAIKPKEFSKYQYLLKFINAKGDKGLGWTPKDPKDRLVIFTERRETLAFLVEQLANDLKLKTSTTKKPKGLEKPRQDPEKDQILELHGGMSDTEQQKIVEVFGQEKMPVRVLVCSDVASEGINLHYLSYRMIHFDIPWSLMVFQQRNGRIDRYGQSEMPQIAYLITDSKNDEIKGDHRILEVLIEKDKQANDNIGDPSAFMKVYDVHEEELITASAIESGMDSETFDKTLDPDAPAPRREDAESDSADGSFDSSPGSAGAFNPFAFLMEPTSEDEPEIEDPNGARRTMPTLFEDDYTYLKECLSFLQHHSKLDLQFSCDDQARRVSLTAPPDLKQRFRYLPREIWPEKGGFQLSQLLDTINREIKESRSSEHAWPQIHYLWELHPVMQWASDRISAFFGRQEAPVLILPEGLHEDERYLLINGVIPNRKSHPLIYRWFGARFIGDSFDGIEPFDDFLQRSKLLQRELPNTEATPDLGLLQQLCSVAVDQAEAWMASEYQRFQQELQPRLKEKRQALVQRQKNHGETIDAMLEKAGPKKRSALEVRRKKLNRDIEEYDSWIVETMQLEEKPYIQVVAAFATPSLNIQ